MTIASEANKSVYSEVVTLHSVTLPEIKQENFTTQHVPYGANDEYLDKVNDYASYSPTHKSILLLKQNMITGGGLMCDKEKNPKLFEAIKKLNPKERSQKTLSKIARDYAKYNGFAFQILWNKTGDRIAEIHWLDFSRIRAEASLDGTPKAYYYSRNWKKYRTAAFKPIRIPVFNPKSILSEDRAGNPVIAEGRQIYYYYEPENDIDFYPVPTYNASFKDIEYEMAYSMYKDNMMANGMFITGIIHYNFIPSPEEQKDIKEKIIKRHAGYQNAGKFVITYSDKGSQTKAVEFEPLSFTPDASLFSQWQDEAMQNIMTAHQLSSPTLAGIAGAGGLGGNASEIRQAFTTYMVTYVSDKQADIVDVFSDVLLYYKDVDGTDTLDISTTLPPDEIPDIAYDYATENDAKKWLKERYNLDFEPVQPDKNGQLPIAFKPGSPGGTQPAGIGKTQPIPTN